MSETIDAEEFERRLAEETTTPKADQNACEFCHSVSIYVRGTGFHASEHDYKCTHCGRPCDGTGDATKETLPKSEVGEQ